MNTRRQPNFLIRFGLNDRRLAKSGLASGLIFLFSLMLSLRFGEKSQLVQTFLFLGLAVVIFTITSLAQSTKFIQKTAKEITPAIIRFRKKINQQLRKEEISEFGEKCAEALKADENFCKLAIGELTKSIADEKTRRDLNERLTEMLVRTDWLENPRLQLIDPEHDTRHGRY